MNNWPKFGKWPSPPGAADRAQGPKAHEPPVPRPGSRRAYTDSRAQYSTMYVLARNTASMPLERSPWAQGLGPTTRADSVTEQAGPRRRRATPGAGTALTRGAPRTSSQSCWRRDPRSRRASRHHVLHQSAPCWAQKNIRTKAEEHACRGVARLAHKERQVRVVLLDRAVVRLEELPVNAACARSAKRPSQPLPDATPRSTYRAPALVVPTGE